jgi:hypothetical protein
MGAAEIWPLAPIAVDRRRNPRGGSHCCGHRLVELGPDAASGWAAAGDELAGASGRWSGGSRWW